MVCVASALPSVAVSLARPKSSTLTIPLVPTMILPGLTSRWIIPAALAGRQRPGDRDDVFQNVRYRHATFGNQLLQRRERQADDALGSHQPGEAFQIHVQRTLFV